MEAEKKWTSRGEVYAGGKEDIGGINVWQKEEINVWWKGGMDVWKKRVMLIER